MPNLRTPRLYTGEEIRNSPSRADGLSEVLENEYRRKTCLFIKAAGKALELPVEAVATALVFFHKFFMLHSFLKHERLFVASACLFLAAKVEESPKRVELVMSKCWAVWHSREPPAEQEKAFKRLREKILIAERCLLHTLGFQMTVEHPYAAVMGLLKKLFSLGRGADGGKGVDKALNRQLSQAATSFVNDSLLTTVCVRYRPDEVAAAVVYLSYLYMGLPRVDAKLLDADEAVVADISDSVLSLYDEHGAGHATMVASELRDKLKGRMMDPTAPASASNSPASTPSPRPPASPRPTPSPSPIITAGVAQTASCPPCVGSGNGDGNDHDNGSNSTTTTATTVAAADASATIATARATASAAPSAPTSVSSTATATATAAPGGTAIERKGGGSDGGCSKADRPPEEEGKIDRDPRDSPLTGRSPKKRKAGEGGDVGMEGLEGEGQVTAVDPKRPRSL